MKFSVKQPSIGNLGQARGWAGISFGDETLAVATTRNDKETSVSAAAATEGETAEARWTRGAQSLNTQVNAHEFRLATAVPCEDVLCQTLSLPATEPSELRQMLELQMDSLTPLPMEEIVYGFRPLEKVGNDTRVLVAVAPKAAVNKRITPLEQAKLPVEIVLVDALAVFRAMLQKGMLQRDENLSALVQLTATTAHIIAYRQGQPLTVRSVMLPVGEGTDAAAVLQEELQRTLVAVQAECPGAAVGRLTFFGPEAERAAAGWNGAAEVLDAGTVPSPAMSVCMEAAADEKAALRLNLLPAEWPERRRKARMRRLLIRSAIAGVIVYLIGLSAFFAFMAVKQVRLSRLESEVKSRQQRYDDTRKLRGELLAIEKQLDQKYSALEVLREVSVLMPEGLKLDSFNFKKDQTVTLRGQTASATTATDFISRLEKCPLFGSVKTVSMPTVAGLTKFEVLCTLKSAAPGTKPTGGGR